MTANVPSWLTLKPEYIEENFEEVFKYLYKNSNAQQRDELYDTTVSLLEQRVQQLLQLSELEPVVDVAEGSGDFKERCVLQIRMLCTYLLVVRAQSNFARAAYCRLLTLLARCDSPAAAKLTTVFVHTLTSGAVSTEEFGWKEVQNFHNQISSLAYRIGQRKFINKVSPVSYESHGTLYASASGLALSTLNKKSIFHASEKPCISILDGQFALMQKENTIKAHESDNIGKLREFTHDFCLNMNNMQPVQKGRYIAGEEVRVMVVGTRNKHLLVRTIDPNRDALEGEIKFEYQTIMGCYETDFIANLPAGSIIPVKVSDTPGYFSIKDTFTKHIMDNKAGDVGDCVPARLLFLSRDVGTWFTEDGYVILVKGNPNHRIGDYAVVKITRKMTECVYGVVEESLDLSDPSVSVEYIWTALPFNDTQIKQDGFEGFIISMNVQTEVRETVSDISRGEILDLCRLLLMLHTQQSNTASRYRHLCVLRALATLVGDSALLSYVAFMASYTESLMAFINASTPEDYGAIAELKLGQGVVDSNNIQKCCNIISLLRCYGSSVQNELVDNMADGCGDEQVQKIAALVQSRGRIANIMNTSIDGLIKREIMRQLSIAVEGRPDLEADSGTYVGVESSTQEFKTSFFEAPKSARETNQEITIFKTICGFLNTDFGGTLFIGVNDSGFVCGIDGDLERLEKLRTNYHGIDGYCRYIQDRAILGKHFEQEHLACLEIAPIYDNKVVAIKVKPYPYGVVKVDGTAYIRINGETMRMNALLIDQVARKKRAHSAEDERIRNIRLAKESRVAVWLRQYSSSSTKSVRDRLVEAHTFSPDKTSVFCYEPEDKKNKVFNISRIGSVEITGEEWKHEAEHQNIKQDIFRMSGDTPIPIKLRLSILAKNCLRDEFRVPDNELKEDPSHKDTWILDTQVYRYEGVGRFVIGLASDIEILHGDGLKAYIQNYLENLDGRF